MTGQASPPALVLAPSAGRGGGIERLITQVCEALRHDFSVTPISLLQDDETLALGSKIRFALRCIAASRTMRPNQGGIVIAMHPAFASLAKACSIMARVPRARTFVVFHGWDIWGKGALRHWLWRRMRFRPVTVSSFSAGALARVGGALILHPTTSPALLELLGQPRPPILSGESVLVLSVFRLSDFIRKGGSELVDAVEAARLQTGRDLQLTLAGSGELPEPARSLVSLRPWITVRSGPSDAELAKLYRTADLFVLASRFDAAGPVPAGEGFGIVLIEAAAAGCLVIASGVGGVTDAVVDRQTGWLVPPGSAAIANQISRALSDPERTRRMAVHARDWALSTHSFEAFRERSVNVFRSGDP